MTHSLYYEPDTCNCKLQQEVDDNDKITLLFFYEICPVHQVAKKPASSSTIKNKRKQILDNFNTLLSQNRTRCVNDFDNSAVVKARGRAIAELQKDPLTADAAAIVEEQQDKERQVIIRGLDDFEKEKRAQIIQGLVSQDAFGGEDVYAVIQDELKTKNDAVNAAYDALPDSFFNISQENNVTVRKPKPETAENLRIDFNWTTQTLPRKLEVSIKGVVLSQNTTDTIKSKFTKDHKGRVSLV